jgi:hypothetical protein
MVSGGGLRGVARVTGLAVAALLVADVVGLAGHGGGTGAPDGAQSIRTTLAQASAHTLGRGTARIGMSFHVQVRAAGVDQSIDEAVQGQGDLTHRLIDMSVVSGPAVGSEFRFVEGVFYEKLPPGLPRPSAVSTPWMSLASGLPSSRSAIPGVQGGSDPTQTLSQLESLSNGAITGAERLGATDIKGVPTSEYRLELDVTKLQAAAQAGAASLGGLTGGTLPTMTFHSMSMTVWVDAQGLIRQQEVTEDISASVRGIEAEVRPDITMDYWDFGLPVDIQAPPSSEVTPVTSLAPQATSA